MPTYEYACRECGQHLEVVQSFTDDPLTVCGSCGGQLRKVFSAAGIIFKGSGYYVTDSRKSSDAGKKSTAGASGDSASASASSTSSESAKPDKPAEKAKPASGEAKSA